MESQTAPRSAFKIAYKIFTWVTLAGLVITILLILHKSPPPNVATDPTASARVEQKFEAAAQATAAGQPAQVQLDSTELNSYLAQNLQLEGEPQPAAAPAAAPAPESAANVAAPAAANVASVAATENQPSIAEVQSSVRDVKIDMDGDLIKAYVVFDLHGKDLSLELKGHLRSENGYLKFEPVAGKLGSFPLPQSALNSAVDRMMSSPENREKLRLPDDISDVRVADGQAVVSYK